MEALVSLANLVVQVRAAVQITAKALMVNPVMAKLQMVAMVEVQMAARVAKVYPALVIKLK
jgi:hypothetical protein